MSTMMERVLAAQEKWNMGIDEHRFTMEQKDTHIKQTYRGGLCGGLASYLPLYCAVAASGPNNRGRAGKGNGKEVNRKKSQ